MKTRIKEAFNPLVTAIYLSSLTSLSLITHNLLSNAGHNLFFDISSLNDYPVHIQIVENIIDENNLDNDLPHFLYHTLVILFYLILPFLSVDQVAYYVVPSLSIASLGLILYFLFKIRTNFIKGNLGEFTLIFFLFTLLIASPITFTTYPHIYFGYIYFNVYHNPTVTLIKPISLVLFYGATFFLGELSRDPRISTGSKREMWILICIATILSLLGKPSYVICLLPAVFLFCMRGVLEPTKSAIAWKLAKKFSVWMFLPALSILSVQYISTYGDASSTDSSIAFMPFAVIAGYVDHDYLLMFRLFFLSVLFPLVVYFFYFSKARVSLRLNCAWLVFAISAFYYYVLIETGPRAEHGNFGWGSQVALFILFVESLIFLLNTNIENTLAGRTNSQRLKYYSCLFIYALHVSSGIIFSVAALS